MPSAHHATAPRIATFRGGISPLSAFFPILLSIFIAILPGPARGDELTGMPQNDPKDLLSYSPAPCDPNQPTGAISFVPLPAWARGVVMPQLPDQLKPLGRKISVASAPAPLAPPPETTAAVSTPAAAAKAKAPASPADSSPALVAISPFLQWVKSNPQAAAAEARQQANSYRPQPQSEGGSPGGLNALIAPGNRRPGSANAQEDPYWLPPLIDSSSFGSGPGAGSGTSGGSAAIYSTPQR